MSAKIFGVSDALLALLSILLLCGPIFSKNGVLE